MTTSTNDIAAAIRGRYGDGWLVLDQVANAPGFGGSRRLDHLAVGVWGSNGARTIGLEVKVQRSDWLRELDQPEKHEAFRKHVCEFWFVVAKGVAQKAEVPVGCGLLELRGSKLVAVVRAQQAQVTPGPQLVAAILRAVVRRSDEVDKARAQFAEFAGRSISVEDLDRLVNLRYSILRRRENSEEARALNRKEGLAWAAAVSRVRNLSHRLGVWQGDATKRMEAIQAACDHLEALGSMAYVARTLIAQAEKLTAMADTLAPIALRKAGE